VYVCVQRAANRSGGNQHGPDLLTWRRSANLPRRARAAATKLPGWRAPLFTCWLVARSLGWARGFRFQGTSAEHPQGGAPRCSTGGEAPAKVAAGAARRRMWERHVSSSLLMRRVSTTAVLVILQST
jgi:hypothetical protein